MNVQGPSAPMKEREDYSEGVKTINDLRQIGEQESDHPILPTISDSSKTISRKAMEMEYLVHTIFVFAGMDRVANLVDSSKVSELSMIFLSYKEFRLQELAMPL